MDQPVFGFRRDAGPAAGAVWLFYKGVGVWGIIIPVAWGFAIVNFVWWIGIGHAGTLISAILLLLKQDWRTSINRFSEAMTLFAVAQAGMFPILHLGRPWLGYWLIPYPNSMWLWPQSTKPADLGRIRGHHLFNRLADFLVYRPGAGSGDHARSSQAQWQKFVYGMLGDGLARIGETLGALSNGLPVVRRPGDAAGGFSPHRGQLRFRDQPAARLAHNDLPALFRGRRNLFRVCHGGYARDPARKWFHLEDLITMRHLDCMGKLMLGTGLIVAYGYMMEAFMSWYSGNPHEMFMYMTRATGPYRYFFWSLILCNILIPQSLWSASVRQNIPRLFFVSIVVNIGMWLERFIIVVTSLARDFLPSSWGMYYPTQWDWAVYVGTLGFFLVLMILFVRVLPSISIFEVREVLHHLAPNVTDDDPAPAPAHGD